MSKLVDDCWLTCFTCVIFSSNKCLFVCQTRWQRRDGEGRRQTCSSIVDVLIQHYQQEAKLHWKSIDVSCTALNKRQTSFIRQFITMINVLARFKCRITMTWTIEAKKKRWNPILINPIIVRCRLKYVNWIHVWVWINLLLSVRAR